MDIQERISGYLAELPEPKRSDMVILHQAILKVAPDCRLWFEDGKNEEGKVVSNPNIGYGSYTIRCASGSAKEFFRVGLSANKTGISIYIMGLEDKTFLKENYGDTIGKASVTGYCIKFKSVADINCDVLLEAVQYRLRLQDA